MARQERTAARTRKAAAQADTIIAKAEARAKHTIEVAEDEVARTRASLKRCPVCGERGTVVELKAAGHGKACASAPQTGAKPRTKVTAGARVVRQPDAGSDPKGAECVKLRNDRLSWMAIGKALGLPGAKDGAAAARKLYAAHTGQSHRTAPGRTRAVKERHAATTGAKRDRRAQVQLGTGLITDDQTDEQVAELLAGKTIQWSIDLKRLADGKGEPEWCEQEARVHPHFVRIEQGVTVGERCVRFRELLGRDDRGNPISGPTRTVRLAAIHTVR